MIKKMLILLLILFSSITCVSQEQKIIEYYDGISFSELSFLGNLNSIDQSKFEIKENHTLAALISTNIIESRQGYTFDSAYAEIRTVMYPEKSWINPAYKQDLYTINHEMYHFKISEIYARKFRKSFMEALLLEDLVGLKTEILKECNIYQKNYDKMTQHGEDREKQREWEVSIDRQLLKLSEFSYPKVSVSFK